MARREPPLLLDVSDLPTVVFGHRNVSWLGNIFYMTIEGMMFALLVATYFYLRTRSTDWPPGSLPPALHFGIANAVVFVISVIPSRWLQKLAPTDDQPRIRLGLLVLSAFGALAIILRIFEFTTLNCRWSDTAYASVVWSLIGLHSGHLVTEWIETLSLLVMSFRGKLKATLLPDLISNSDYWHFVVVLALVLDAVIYLSTRLL